MILIFVLLRLILEKEIFQEAMKNLQEMEKKMKNVKDIAREIDSSNFNSQKLRQRIRDEIKRQQIATEKNLGKITISDKDAEAVIKALEKEKKEKENSRNNEDSSRIIKKLQEQIRQKDTEINRLNKKIEDYADDFRKMSLNQQQLTNQQQQLQAKMLESKKLLEDRSNENDDLSSENQELKAQIDKIKNSSFWDRVFGRF